MNIYYELLSIKKEIPRNTYKTILGQIKTGNLKGAETGIARIKAKMKGRESKWLKK